jgi:hypothetical protein
MRFGLFMQRHMRRRIHVHAGTRFLPSGTLLYLVYLMIDLLVNLVNGFSGLGIKV